MHSRPVICCLAAAVLAACTSPQAQTLGDETMFASAMDAIELEDADRRKWDAPVIADLDRDGYPDLLLTDHGFAVKVYWNDSGSFSKGIDVIMGDTHGVGVADYNSDGKIEVVIARGGGSGTNARSAKGYRISKDRDFEEIPDFDNPLKTMRGRTVKFIDGDNDGDLDMLLTGIPLDFAALEGANYVYENTGSGNFEFSSYLPKTNGEGHKVLVTDFDTDGVVDLLFYGAERLSALRGNGDLTYTDVSSSVLSGDIADVTAIAEIDFDNDGDFDLYLSRGTRPDHGETYFDEDTSTFAFYARRGQFQFDDLTIGDTLDVVNYQAAWPHQDILIGESAYEYEHPGEYHKGQHFRMINSNALGWPDKQNENGLYMGYVGNDAWRLAVNVNPPTTGVIQGVSHYPASEHVPGPVDVLLRNDDGVFVDVTAASGLSLAEHTTGIAVGDYDNNGFSDLFVMRRGNLATSNNQLLYLNAGDDSFALANDHGLIAEELGAMGGAAEAVDFDLDGRLDLVFGNERGKWHLFRNNSVLNDQANFTVVEVGNSPSGQSTAPGAVATIIACGTAQTRRVGATSAPYSQGLDTRLHFGLGACAAVSEVTIRWPNGESSTTPF